MEKYIVTADISREGFSKEKYLFGIFDSIKDALNFMLHYQAKPLEDIAEYGMKYGPDYFDFIDNLVGPITDENLIYQYVTKFDGTPINLSELGNIKNLR